ncbi:MAG: hypothetical protein ABI675_19795 [Chitinophagaceae bacterium]
MKTIVLVIVFLLSITAKSQSLLDAVYGGKVKADTGAVLRKGDSLKIRENMAQKVIADSIRKDSMAAAKATAAIEKQNAGVAVKDSITTGANTSSAVNTTVSAVPVESIPAEKASAPKDNNRIWKTFIDSFTTTIKSEVLSSGKIKKGTYSVLINYEIKPDGQVNINSVASDPQSSFLDDQIKMRLTLDTPQLNPVLGTNGQPRTVAKKQMLTFVK